MLNDMNVPQVVPIFDVHGFHFVVRIDTIVSIVQFTSTLSWGPPILSGVDIVKIAPMIVVKQPLVIWQRRWVATPQAQKPS